MMECNALVSLNEIADFRVNNIPKNDKGINIWKGIHIIAFIGLFIRIIVSIMSDHVYHADEIFQYLEQAHRLVFGYGYIPWEYRFGIRSWIIPGFLAGILYFCKLLQLNTPLFYVNLIKVIFCIASTSLIYSTYIIGRETISEYTGRLSALLVAIWYELIFFSAKPTPEVLGTYFLMGAFACAVMKEGQRNPVLFGFFATMGMVLRLQYAGVSGILFLFVLSRWKKKMSCKLYYLVS